MLNELSKEIHANSVAKGFYEQESSVAERICLMHSELSEALEADRNYRFHTYQPPKVGKPPDEIWKPLPFTDIYEASN